MGRFLLGKMFNLINKMCLNKQIYKSKQEALDILEYSRRKAVNEGREFPNNLKVYKCPLCQNYHLGSKKR